MDYKKDKSNDLTNVNHSENKFSSERSLKINNFNPMKGSPNLFMTKLEFRLQHYQMIDALEKDPFTL